MRIGDDEKEGMNVEKLSEYLEFEIDYGDGMRNFDSIISITM
jgi:uncharacterized protein YozE (UPF0346 family)